MQSLARRLESGGVLPCPDICASAQPFFTALLRQLLPQHTLVIVTDTLKTQEGFQQDLITWLPPKASAPLFYPPWDVLPHESRLPHADTISDRLETLVGLSRPSTILVTSVTALLQKTFPAGFLRDHTRTLQRGDRSEPLDLVEWLESQGYEPEAQVTQKGELALRGGILDVWPLTAPWPVRLEFFGNELESLRQFDPLTQISREEVTSVTLPPGGELGLLKQSAENAGSLPELASLLDYLPRETILVLCDPEQLSIRADEYTEQVPDGDRFFMMWEALLAAATERGMTRLELSEGAGVIPGLVENEDGSPVQAPATDGLENPQFQSLEAFRPVTERAADPQIAEAQRREFFSQIHRWLRQEYAVRIFCNNDGERQRFLEIWNELGLGELPALAVQLGNLSRGFLNNEAKTVVVTDAEIFGRYRVQRPRRMRSAHAATVRSSLEVDFTDLDDGDYVVHLQHGIGRYLGLKTMPLGSRDAGESGAGVECLTIEYAGDPSQPSPKLYVPVTEAHLVSKYVGVGKVRPPLNALGGTRWAKAKAQAETAVRDVAAELLAIQAARESQAGHPFAADTSWQREFESAFVYEETPDQMRSILETKADMERPKPMDRLICGDAGFGKTEVAIRAAFKAVMDGRQVAVLVPTTVLAQQHFNTFCERMADYPVRVELLSRYRSRKEQDAAIKNLAAGAVDIVIGTHRLVQSDIVFKELGLVIIDEEQRFGVLHKEKFKRLRTLVDVLTLSATPIPRTLYLALTGARDMSTIQTPPHDRLPVETIVTNYDDKLVHDAIQRELNRGGQVFFLHNRVTTIGAMADRLKRLLPNARIVVGHGQMPEHELEEVMASFVNGEADVLLSTTIIESGLDIPNANTIIIDRADRFGLSDLYQLRGRVGRYKHQAYAYLLLPRHARLLTDVSKRINALKQYSTLGSGFKIAMRDLEIRGAGNLLGSAQSGHITAVGFELYCQLLKQSVASLKGEKVKPRVEVRIHIDFLELNAMMEPADAVEGTRAASASLPHNYAPEPQQRIEVYRKLAQATDKPALEALTREMRDRFGPLPPPVELLLLLAELKILAGERGVSVIEVKEDKLMLTRQGDFITLGGKFPRLTKKQPAARLKEIKKLLLAM